MTAPDAAPRSRSVRALRGVGAFAFWGLAESVAFVRPGLVGAALGAIVAAAFIWWYVGRRDYPGERRRRATLRLRPPGPALAWVPAALVAMLACSAASLVVMSRVTSPPRTNPAERFEGYPFGWVAFTVLAVGLAPMMEEFLFRGWLQRNLERRMAAARAILVTALVFAAVHVDATTLHPDLFGFPSRFVVGLTLGYFAYASRSIVPSTMLHASYNGALLLADRLGVGDQAGAGTAVDTARVFWLAVAGGGIALLALGWVVRAMMRSVAHTPGPASRW